MASPSDNRRVAARLVHNADVPFRSGVDLGTASIRDLSLTGAGLVLTRAVEPGQIIAIELPSRDEAGWRLKLIRVAHATAQGNTWVVGGPFVHPLTEEELQLLV